MAKRQRKAVIMLWVLCALQLVMLLRGLHHHESACQLSATDHSKQVLHPHADEHGPCAWAGVHLTAWTVSFPPSFFFYSFAALPQWHSPVPEAVQLISLCPPGRAPPAFA